MLSRCNKYFSEQLNLTRYAAGLFVAENTPNVSLTAYSSRDTVSSVSVSVSPSVRPSVCLIII